MLVNWDNYPNVPVGGVYIWVKALVESLHDWEFVVFNQLSNSNANGDYSVSPNVSKVIQLPLFGTHRREEYDAEGRALLSKILLTTDSAIKSKFLPAYDEFIASLIAAEFDAREITRTVFNLHKILTVYDARKCLEHYLTWETFLDQIQSDPLYREMSLGDALMAFQSLQRGLQVLSVELPEVDLVHCSLAWIPSLTAIPAKMIWNCPVMLTEHGVSYRELLLYYNAFLHNEPSKLFWTTFSRNIVKACYAAADMLVPVCKANAYWESYLGAEASKIRVVYNGIDTNRFKPSMSRVKNDRPTIVSVARVDIFKDIIGLIQAINYVREHIPNVQCLLYGSAMELDYAWRCVKLVKSLHLENNFQFMGSTNEPEKAYNQGDIVVFSSLTEGFPFTIVEAMACGKAIVASDVGGVAEALEGCGVLVRSRRPQELAAWMIRLLEDRAMRQEMEKAAHRRANELFSLDKMTNEYRDIYNELIAAGNKEDSTVIAQ